jgi:hypothetical protein
LNFLYSVFHNFVLPPPFTFEKAWGELINYYLN